MEKIDIASKEDLEKLLYAIIDGKKVTLGEVKPIPFALRFKGERFKVVDGYISADFADILVTFKKDYRSFLALTTGKARARDAEILFKVEDGSIQLDFSNFIPEEILTEVLNKVDGTQITITFIIALIGYFSHSAWKNYLENKKQEITAKQVTDANNNQKEVALKAIEALSKNRKIEVAKNRPMRNAIALLGANEALEVSDVDITTEDIEEYNYSEEVDDITVVITDNFTIHGFEKKAFGWEMKLKATDIKSKPRQFWALSKLTPEDNMKMFGYADNADVKKITVSIVKNRDKIKEAYITVIS